MPDDILSFLDRSATDWPDGVAVAIYKLAKRCLDSRKRRPEISEVVNSIFILYLVIQYKQFYFDHKNVFNKAESILEITNSMFIKYCCVFTQSQIILREMVTRWCMLVTFGFVKHVRILAIQHMVL